MNDQLRHYEAKLGFRVKELIGGADWWERDGFELARGARP